MWGERKTYSFNNKELWRGRKTIVLKSFVGVT